MFKHHPLIFTAALFVAFITGCASLGLEPAKTFDERLAYAVAQNAGVRTAAARSLDAGDIAVEDAKAVLEITDQARTLLDAARVAADAGDLQTAEARVALATSILLKLQQHLRERASP